MPALIFARIKSEAMKKESTVVFTKSVIALFLLGLVTLSGCAHGPKAVPTSGASGKSIHEVERFRLGDPEPPQVTDEELEVIPVEINPKVEQWISYFQGRGRPHMERYLARSTRYSALMKRILRENGLPEDLIYIALIESGFNWKAASHASAVGYWQFIRGTGKRYGLEINSLIDERRDPVLATQAAAEYFKGLYSIFGSWYLAMASYNVGENRVQKEIVRNKTRDFWEISRRKRLPKETVNYVPKFIAAKLIGRNPEKYGFTDIDYQAPLEFELIKIENPVNIRIMAERLGMDYEDFKHLNPKFRGEIAPPKANNILELRVPLGKRDVALVAASQSVVDKIEFVADAGETKTYRVRRGDNIAGIAKRHKTTVAWLREVNDLGSRKKLRIGQRIQVPDPARKSAAVRTFVAKNNPVAPAVNVAPAAGTQPVTNTVDTKTAPKESSATNTVIATLQPGEAPQDIEVAATNPEIETAQGTYYVVQSGDSLYSIAQEYDSTIKELLKLNKMKKGRTLRVGVKIRVPKDEKLPVDPGVDAQKTEKAKDSTAEQKSEITEVRAPSSNERMHIVRQGDNLFRISRQYGVSMTAIQQRNGIREPSDLSVGKKLFIP